MIGGRDTHTRWGMFDNMDHDYNPKVWRALEMQLKRVFPSLRDVRVAYRWAGAVSVNADTTPEIGFVGDERIIYSTGCIGHGVSLTHLNARLIADLLNGRQTRLTDFWIVNRSAIRLPGKVVTFLGTKLVRNLLVLTDRLQERQLPDL